jgi:hypothetical protein
LFSGEDALPELVAHAADYSLGVLIMLIACKALAYGLSLSAFRGGPVFPSMFIGAAIGIAASGLPGMDLAPAIGMGIGAMCAAMLRLPLTRRRWPSRCSARRVGHPGGHRRRSWPRGHQRAPVPAPPEPTIPPADTPPAAPPPPRPPRKSRATAPPPQCSCRDNLSGDDRPSMAEPGRWAG